jgi:DNA-binding transcriptional ArsR family regulator
MKVKDAVVALGALASGPRLGVYRMLVKRGPEGYTPSELSSRLEVPGSTLSFHLKGLVQAGLVVSRRDGRNLYYSPDFEHMNALAGFLTENCWSSLWDDMPLRRRTYSTKEKKHETPARPCIGARY